MTRGLYPDSDTFTHDPYTISKCYVLVGSLDEEKAKQLASLVVGVLLITESF